MKHRIFQAKSQRNKVQGSKLQRVTHWTRNRFGITYIMRSMEQETIEYQWVMPYGRAFGFPGAAPIHRFIVRMILKKSHLTFLTPPRSLPLRPPAAHIQILNSHFFGNGVAEVLNRGSVEAERRWSKVPGSLNRRDAETWFAEAGIPDLRQGRAYTWAGQRNMGLSNRESTLARRKAPEGRSREGGGTKIENMREGEGW